MGMQSGCANAFSIENHICAFLCVLAHACTCTLHLQGRVSSIELGRLLKTCPAMGLACPIRPSEHSSSASGA